MRAKNSNRAKTLKGEFIPVELHRVTEEEFDMWDQEPCVASAD
ncbi:MAG: hypothetical protein PHH28_09115 [Desulfuromonadaceae bacterium]|nr:hypothetical protein [Desulfuromonadaceae bacterium]